MARTAPVPNIPAIPGMNPGVWVLAGGAGSGGSGGKDGDGSGDGQGADGSNGGNDADGGGKGAGECGAGSGAGCPNPSHGGGQLAAGDPVDVVTGRVYTVSVVDLALPGPLPLSIRRSYSSSARDRDIGLGLGWSHSLAWEIEERRRTMRIWTPQGTFTQLVMPDVGARAVTPRGVLTRHAWGYSLAVEGGDVLLFGVTIGGRKLVSRVVDRNANAIELAYDGPRLATITDSVGRVVRVRRHESGHIASFEVKNSPSQGRWIAFRSYDYDARGHLVTALDATGHAMRFTYDDGLLTTQTYPGGAVVHHRYDLAARCIETWVVPAKGPDDSLDEGVPAVLADGITRAKGVLHCKIDFAAEGYSEVATSRSVRRYFGDASGLVTKAVWGAGVHTSEYDARGDRVSYTDPFGATWKWEHDAEGHVVRELSPLGATTERTYTGAGLAHTVTNALGQTIEYAHDERGNLVGAEDGLGSVIRYERDARGLITTATMPNGAVTRMAYDAMGNRVLVREPDGAERRIEHDHLGQVIAFTEDRGRVTRYAYSDRRELTAIYGPDGATLRYEHDEDGRLAAITDADGRRCELVWGGFGAVTEVRRPDGTRVRYRYDREGQLVRVINERGEEHRIVRDDAGRVIAEDTFDGRKVRYGLDLIGRVTKIENGAGEVTELVYDLEGRVVTRSYHDDTSDVLEHDPLGRLVRIASGTSAIAYDHDERGRVVRETQQSGGRTHTIESQHDAVGQRTRRTSSLGMDEQWTFDLSGRPSRALLDAATPLAIAREGSVEIERALRGATIASARDTMGRVTAWRLAKTSAPSTQGPAWVGRAAEHVLASQAYRYTPAGELVEESDHRGEHAQIEHDAIGQVVSRLRRRGKTERFTYEPGGLLHEEGLDARARSYAKGGKLVRRGAVEYVYDDDARLVARKTRATSGDEAVVRYRWSGRGLLEGVELPDGRVIELGYDAFARRTEKRVRAPDGAATVTRFVWDGDVIAHEIRARATASGDVVTGERTYAFMPGTFEPVAHRDVAIADDGSRDEQAWVHYVNDPVGRPRALVSDEGDVLAWLDGDVWGHVEPQGDARASTPLRFSGQYEDEEIGLYYNRFRYYDPETGRYASADPIGLEGGLSAFGYADGRPFAESDPLGLATRTTVAGPYSDTPGGTPSNSRSGASFGGQARTPEALHPAVQNALVPAPPGGVNARGWATTQAGEQVAAGPQPHLCGEPWAMTNYLRNYEHANDLERDSLNPEHPAWNDCIGSITSISSTNGGEHINPCPNCSQMLANLGVQNHQVTPDAAGNNFSPPGPGFADQQAAAGAVVHTAFPVRP